jgi:hypothetical protein
VKGGLLFFSLFFISFHLSLVIMGRLLRHIGVFGSSLCVWCAGVFFFPLFAEARRHFPFISESGRWDSFDSSEREKPFI